MTGSVSLELLLSLAAMVALLSAGAVRVVRLIALKRVLLDQPNDRSSHTAPTPRLGGAAFVPIVILGVVLAWPAGLPMTVKVAFSGGMLGLYLVSLVDDIRSLPTGIRFAVQFAAAGGFLAAFYFACPAGTVAGMVHALPIVPSNPEVLSPPATGEFWSLGTFVFWSLLTFWIVGVVNVYNFMDGIDGLAGVQAVVAGSAWSVIGIVVGSPAVTVVATIVAAAAVGFLTLNWPPAKIFMGDAGSTVLGFVFSTLPLIACLERHGQRKPFLFLCAGGLILWPFLADGTFTLLRRLSRRENIFQAHRSHVYQRLVMSGLGHRTVTLIYGALALVGGIGGVLLLLGFEISLGGIIGLAITASISIWLWAVRRESSRD